MSRRHHSGILALGISLAALAGCAGIQHAAKPMEQQISKEEQEEWQGERAREKELMQILDVGSISELVYLGDGYVTSREVGFRLMNIAGIYSGEVKVRKFIDGEIVRYNTHGWVIGMLPDSPYFRRAIQEADNGDGVITFDEVRSLTERVFEEYSR